MLLKEQITGDYSCTILTVIVTVGAEIYLLFVFNFFSRLSVVVFLD